ncbi:MAG TPA: hypothetical protein H9797_00620 [Candidatus Gallimonas gallistercoris]|uniref:Uncharacterized protein n=1 Tax=Candidatus Gallimonas gallistercoris TaxID=2838602 RepID=A0A9D2H1L3_9FIRM|nr:hypothetical protein [Candidatus Gallimonas gallistercoris]
MTASSLQTPALTPKRVRVRPSLFSEASGKTAAFALNFKARGSALYSVGGRKFCKQLPAGASKLFCTEDGTLFVWTGSALIAGGNTFPLSEAPLEVLSFSGEAGKEYYALTSSGLVCLGEGAVSGAPAGSAAAFFGERLFIASGETLFYSAPLAPKDWTQSADGAGSVVLPSVGGNILKLLPDRGRLLLFRERGVTALSAPGDFLGFEAEELPCAVEGLMPSSVARCGSRVLFCSKEGIFSLKGETLSRLSGCGEERIAFQRGVSAVSAGERYYAAVTLKDGEKCILEIEGEGAALYRLEAESLAGGKFRFLKEGSLYALDEEAAGDKEAVLELPLSTFGLFKVRYLNALLIEGEGLFRAELRAEPCAGAPMPAPRFVRGRAGEEVRLNPPMRGGAFALKVRFLSAGAKLSAVTLTLREGKA